MIAKGCLIALAYVFTYYTFGIGLAKLARAEEPGFTRTFVGGMFFYDICFMAYVLPLKYNRVPLRTISAVWGILWAVLVIGMCVLLRRSFAGAARRAWRTLSENRLNGWLLFLFTAVQIVFNILYGRWSGSTDPSEYVAYVSTAMFTGELGTTDPLTGYYRNSFNAKLFTQTFLDHSAVVSGLFHVHPLIEIRYVTPFIFFLTGNLVVFMLARAVFPKSREKQWLFFAVYQFIVALTSGAKLGFGFYIYFRNYEGKDALTALMIPIVFYVIWKLYREPRDRRTLAFGMLCSTGIYHYTGTGMYLVPAMCLGFLPGIFRRETRKDMFFNAVLLILPNLIYMAFYYGISRAGILPGIGS